MSTHRDRTAEQAIGRVDRGTRTVHRGGCWVDGGTRRHGINGWRCPRCAEQRGDGPEIDLLMRLDQYAGGAR